MHIQLSTHTQHVPLCGCVSDRLWHQFRHRPAMARGQRPPCGHRRLGRQAPQQPQRGTLELYATAAAGAGFPKAVPAAADTHESKSTR
jgi:hypothetical protein